MCVEAAELGDVKHTENGFSADSNRPVNRRTYAAGVTGETKKRGELPFMAILGLLGTWATALPVVWLMPYAEQDPTADELSLGYLWLVVYACGLVCPAAALVVALVVRRWNWAAVSAAVLALSVWYGLANDVL